MTTQDLLAAVKSIQPLIEAHAAEAEANRQLSSVVYDAMYRANLFAMSAPRARGGLELHPVESMQVWEAIARIDSAAAWNLVMNQGIAAYAAWLPAEGADDLFSQGVPTIAGALFPSGQAIRVAGGWRVTGQVSFGSGCQNAQWLAMPMIEMANDQPKHNPETGQPSPFGVFFPKSDAKILDTWHT
jgi:indole-3-acetate monooxygenase